MCACCIVYIKYASVTHVLFHVILVAIYSAPSGELNTLFQGQVGGVTQVLFSTDGLYLFSGGRKVICSDILCVCEGGG